MPSRTARWLCDDHLIAPNAKTKWKDQYKLKHNWTKGTAAVNEIPVGDQAIVPPVLVQMHDGIIYMADSANLRAWSAKGSRKMVAQCDLNGADSRSSPTALALHSSSPAMSRVAIGYEDGAFEIHELDHQAERFRRTYRHPPSSNGVVSAAAICWPYVTTLTATQVLSLYRFHQPAQQLNGSEVLDPPRLLHSLRSHTVWPPLSTSLRASSASITVSMAYAIPTYLSGWTVGLQEVRVSPNGDLQDSRLASAIHQHYRPLAFAAPPMTQHLTPPMPGSLATSTATELRHIHSKPTSLSYSHPYLLVSHPDNTLTLYLVTSTAESLQISAGSRLWGHTSAVSGAHVGGRGKAVSVSRRGDELRVWELEGGFGSVAAKKRLASGDLSVRIRSGGRASGPSNQTDPTLLQRALRTRNAGTGSCASELRIEDASDLTLTRGWVGFDEENVVLLKEQSQGRQSLVVYDFT